jgi:hypothetical protein
LQILYWIYEIAIHSRAFTLELPVPTNIDMRNLYYFFFWQGIGFVLLFGKMQECLQTIDLSWNMNITKIKKGCDAGLA